MPERGSLPFGATQNSDLESGLRTTDDRRSLDEEENRNNSPRERCSSFVFYCIIIFGSLAALSIYVLFAVYNSVEGGTPSGPPG